MARWGLFMLRVSTGWLLVMWGLDKLLDVEHAQRVSESFYMGIASSPIVQNVFGALEVVLGLCVVVGFWRKFAYPIMTVLVTITALAVWRSIIDPWGWFLEGSNVLFYPSFIIAAGALTLWGTIEQDTMALDARGAGGRPL